MRVAVNSHALPIYKKKRIASLLCIFETIIPVYQFKQFHVNTCILVRFKNIFDGLCVFIFLYISLNSHAICGYLYFG